MDYYSGWKTFSEIGRIFLENSKICCGEIMTQYDTSEGKYWKCSKCNKIKNE